MTMRLDIVSNDAGELVRLERARDMGAATVQSVYRIVKLVQLHDMGNQAFVRQLEQTHEAILEYGARAGVHFNVLFASRAIFVGGQLLKGSRAAYEMATELGDILEWCGGSDLTILKDVTQMEIQAFAEAVGQALRAAKGSGYKAPSPRIRLRPVTDAARFRGLEVEALTFEQKVVRTYASAVIILRRFFTDLTESRYVLPRRIKRVAQSLVDLSEGSTPAFLGVTDVRNQNFDDAGRGVNTAILAVSMARELTQDRVLLAQIAMAAMMHDVGRPRAAALGEAGPRMPGAVRLSEDAEDKLAAGTAAVLTALGRVNEPTITRTVIAFESLWLRRERYLGPLYSGVRPPAIHSKIIQISRRYNDLVTPEPGMPDPEPDMAVANISRDMPDELDQTVLRLLVATLNLLPAGTIVALTTKEVAEIVPAPNPEASAPKGTWVRILRDPRGALVEPPFDVDLTAPNPNDPERRIARVLTVDGWARAAEAAAAAAAEEAPISSGGGDRAAAIPDARPRQETELEVQEELEELGEQPLELEEVHEPAELLEVEPRVTLDYVPPEAHTDEVEQASDQALDSGTSPSSSSVPSIASILSPGVSRAVQPSNIVEASAPYVSGGEGSNPSSGTSPSMVAQAMGRVMEEGAQRPVPVRPTRSIALFEDPMIEVVAQLEELEPTARGTLTSTPLVHVLVYMLDHRQTGTVVLREVDGRHHVLYFDEGRACMVRNGRPVALLGDGLVAAGLISPEVLVKALEVARRAGSLLGDYLVGSGLVGAEALRLALSAQVPRKIERLVNLAPETDYAFYLGVNLIEDWAKAELFPCQPLSAILSAVRSWHDRARVRQTLSRIAKQVLTFHPELDLSEFILAGEEQAVVEAIHNTSSTLSSLYDLRVAGEDTVSSIVYTFAVTRSFAFTAAKGPPMLAIPVLDLVTEDLGEDVDMNTGAVPPASAQPAPEVAAPPPAPRPVPVPVAPPRPAPVPRPVAAPQAPRPAPAAFAPAPWQTSSQELRAPVVPRPAKPPPAEAETVIQRPLEAETVIQRPPKQPSEAPSGPRGAPPSTAFRESQVRKAAPRPQAAEEDSEALVQAMADFRMAEAALQRNETPLADELARKALAAEPLNPDYSALVAWTGALSGTKGDAIPLAIAKLNVILKDEPLCERALLYRGRLYKRAKRSAEALRDFTAVLDINPRHAEASIEVRLLKMKKK